MSAFLQFVRAPHEYSTTSQLLIFWHKHWDDFPNQLLMFFHYCKLAWRNLTRNKLFTFINVFGLALSLSIGLIWQLYFPLNKNLWTSSFVLVTGGAALLVLSVITWLIDVKGFRPGTKPFIVFGSNAIASYMLSFVLLYLVFAPFFRDGKTINANSNAFLLSLGCSPNFSSLMWAFLYTGLYYIPVSMLYKKKIFLKV